MTEDLHNDLKNKITIAIQKIQDNVVPGAKGLDRTEISY